MFTRFCSGVVLVSAFCPCHCFPGALWEEGESRAVKGLINGRDGRKHTFVSAQAHIHAHTSSKEDRDTQNHIVFSDISEFCEMT